jgi:hypothetical protein
MAELMRNHIGCCVYENGRVIIKDYKGKELVNCTAEEFTAFVPFISAVYDYTNGDGGGTRHDVIVSEGDK